MSERNEPLDERNTSSDITAGQSSKCSESSISESNTNYVMSTFQLFLTVVQEESKKLYDVRIEKQCYCLKIYHFDFKEEQIRLSYLYKFSPVVPNLVDKCISDFLVNRPKEENCFFPAKTNICSLSSGAGIDIVGYLSALCKFGVMLNGFPTLKVISSCEQWNGTFRKLAFAAYQDYCKVFNANPTDMPSENIKFISCNIFKALPPEVEKYIKECDVLLMVFSCGEAPYAEFITVLQKIFSLLKRGTVVFLIDGKKKINTVAASQFLKNQMFIIHGPEKIVVRKLPMEKYVLEKIEIFPVLSYKVHFVVLQKKIFVPVNKETFKLQRFKKVYKPMKRNEVKQSNCEKCKKEILLHELLPDEPPHKKFAVNVPFNPE